MTAQGQNRTLSVPSGMSSLPPKVDTNGRAINADSGHRCSSWRMIALYACHEWWKKVFLSRQFLIDDQF